MADANVLGKRVIHDINTHLKRFHRLWCKNIMRHSFGLSH